ncbi:hypothetical protein ZOSMA_116G00890 [Zostera marina]|uniref:Uncharacterized protein n=1 Tax=Zostera marina TaxID=29655 RepID=A0A0K9Q244_ZOSMR|nr:hypothetical protein ZOSMA_116G00890 [Zostera marina]
MHRFSPRILSPKQFALIKSPYERISKENIKLQSAGPSKLNETKHLMLQQSYRLEDLLLISIKLSHVLANTLPM